MLDNITIKELLKKALKENIFSESEFQEKLNIFLLNNKISNEDYLEIMGNNAEISIETLKQQKKFELWTKCNDSILYGFHFNFNDIDYLIGFDTQDQNNLTQTAVLLDNITGDIVWKVKGDLTFLTLTKTDFLNMLLVAKNHKESNMQKYFMLCTFIEDATTKEELDNINW